MTNNNSRRRPSERSKLREEPARADTSKADTTTVQRSIDSTIKEERYINTNKPPKAQSSVQTGQEVTSAEASETDMSQRPQLMNPHGQQQEGENSKSSWLPDQRPNEPSPVEESEKRKSRKTKAPPAELQMEREETNTGLPMHMDSM